jgi:hypothetical protein
MEHANKYIKNIYILAYIHAYIYTCMHTYNHACIHTYIIRQMAEDGVTRDIEDALNKIVSTTDQSSNMKKRVEEDDI